MICFPNAKINLGLNIIEKRADGFHTIETVFYPVAWCDALEIIENTSYQAGSGKISFSMSGLEVAGNPEDNLICKAYHLLDKEGQLPPLTVHLHKVIPMGAGLGGGSSDAAFFIQAVNKKCALQLSVSEQMEVARKLGSDCAFFLANEPVYASERGDVFTPISIDLSPYQIYVVYPAIHCNTALAYKGITPAPSVKNIREVLKQPIHTWRDELKNDFEKNGFIQYPEIEQVKHTLYAQGALYAAMSGSGSAVFGIFESKADIGKIGFPGHYVSWSSGA